MTIHSQKNLKSSILTVAAWAVSALIFNVVIYYIYGPQLALEFLTGYLIEQSLSIDNIFVFIVIFESFQIHATDQKKILKIGIFSAIVLRGLFILIGVQLIHRFSWIYPLFGIFLIFTALKMFQKHRQNQDFKHSKLYAVITKIFPITHTPANGRFLIYENKKWHLTMLSVVLLLIELTDVIFALDSLPAIFAVTQNPLIVFSSNIFAIGGLRALYHILAYSMAKFQDLKYGIAVTLLLIGGKLVLMNYYKFPLIIFLILIFISISASILVSIIRARRTHPPINQLKSKL